MTDDKPFVHLHVHTEYSLLDGLSRIPKLVERAKALDMPALAITDHGTMFGVIDFYRACKKAGIKPIIGMESYLAKRTRHDRDPKEDRKPYHMLLLAKNQAGYKNLLKLASYAQLEGYYYNPRIDRELLAAHSEGLIATSGCLAAEIPNLITAGKDDEARATIGWYQDVFGPENFFLELQQHDIPILQDLNKWLYDYRQSGHSNVQLLATNDVHYVRKEDSDPHDTLLCIQTSTLKSDTNRLRMSDASYYLTDQAEMWSYFADAPEALFNTLRVAEMCDLDLDKKGYHLPIFPVPEGFDAGSYLRHLCEKGLRWRYGDHPDAHLTERLDYELGIINKMGFDTYFLIVWDLCQFARHADIWWNVRGSGAGSIAAYSLGITSIDPIQNNLLFERFLNPGRISMPDIDMDFPDDRRGEMIEYTARKYGEDKVAAIITFGTMGAKAAVRDVGRALDIDLSLVNQAARLIPTEPKPKPVMQYVEDNPDLKKMYDSMPQIRQIVDTASELQGVSRHASTHAAGIIVSDRPLVEYMPLHRQTKGNVDENSALTQVTQFPMETCESIGMLKIDFLGLSTLTIVRRACDLIERHRGIRYTMENIPYRPGDDPEQNRMLEGAFELLGRGDTVGVFQVESSGMQQMLRGMRPKLFEHIVAAISLYRPGPMDYIPLYNDRMHGKQPTVYHHPKLEAILGETYGICISGDSYVFDATTGQRLQVRDMAQLAAGNEFWIQGVDENYQTIKAPVSHWIFNGNKPVYRVKLHNGTSIKTTIDHRFLSEDGWKPLEALSVGAYVATPPSLIEPSLPGRIEREKLRVLAYLIADGSLASGVCVDFVNKDERMIEEYEGCLTVFDDVETVYVHQIHDVLRVGIRNSQGKAPTSLLKWMRELGLKYRPGSKPGGVRSQEKSIPEFIFTLSNDDLAFFVASLWDCDGYMGQRLCHYKTISKQLAEDVQTLLLRLGIPSVIHQSSYLSIRGERAAYQVTLYETARLAELIQQYMVSDKATVVCTGSAMPTIERQRFIDELDSATTLSRRQLMSEYGIDRQHFMKKGRSRPRISASVVRNAAVGLQLAETITRTNVVWEEIESIEYVGVEDVYDLTVDQFHNFVANGIIVHNCVYQEQIMQIAGNLFGYSLGEADMMRRAVSKKKKEDLQKHREIFLKNGPEHGVDEEAAGKIFDDIEFFANYGFNKSHAADYGVITVQSAFLKAHYPAEYMTALLSVYYDDATRVTNFLGECKRLNIAILPPDVNYSEMDFAIQTQPDGKVGIRFGLAAIKNAGIGALQHLLDARGDGGPFHDIEDFCTRIDLRMVGKRAIESLIKVGALASLGTRPQLLNALDRMMTYSGEHHRARDVGQASLFGEAAGMTGNSLLKNLPQVEEATLREMLNWERELLGLYISSHPIDPALAQLDPAELNYTHLLKDPENAVPNAGVRVVALIAGMRKLPTKNQEMMCIAQLEDRFGLIDAVLFPRTWARYEDVMQEGAVVLVTGKLDVSRGDPQILVESVSQEFIRNIAVPDMTSLPEPRREWADALPDEPEPVEAMVGEPALASANGHGNGYSNGGNGNGRSYGNGAAHADPPFEPTRISQPMEEPPSFDEAPPAWMQPEPPRDARPPVPVNDDPFGDEEKPQRPPKRVLVQFHRTEEPDKDRRRLQRVHRVMTSYPGIDRFSIELRSKDGAYILDFPNDTTDCCDRLYEALKKIEGIEFEEHD